MGGVVHLPYLRKTQLNVAKHVMFVLVLQIALALAGLCTLLYQERAHVRMLRGEAEAHQLDAAQLHPSPGQILAAVVAIAACFATCFGGVGVLNATAVAKVQVDIVANNPVLALVALAVMIVVGRKRSGVSAGLSGTPAAAEGGRKHYKGGQFTPGGGRAPGRGQK